MTQKKENQISAKQLVSLAGGPKHQEKLVLKKLLNTFGL